MSSKSEHTHRVTCKAGPFLNVDGRRNPGIGRGLTLSEEQARYAVMSGEIVASENWDEEAHGDPDKPAEETNTEEPAETAPAEPVEEEATEAGSATRPKRRSGKK